MSTEVWAVPDEYTYFFCRNRQQGTCAAPYVNVAIAEQAVERYYTAVSQQEITNALTTLGTHDAVDRGRPRDATQVYRSCTDDQRRLLNHALFRRLYLAEARISNHEPWPTSAQTQTTCPNKHDTLRE